jgi:succinate-semialdehyde dehydrogenase/glutarate-semialdehyde dehydrogenase
MKILKANNKMSEQNTLIKNAAYINGEWVNTNAGTTFPVYDPATGEVIGNVANLTRADVTKAIDDASNAWQAWRLTTAKERSSLLKKWFEIIIANKEELARLMTMECGKPLSESLTEIAYGAGFIEWFAEEARRVYGEVIPQHTADRRLLTIKQPVGVVAAITPWNFPLAMITRKVGPALAAGCTVVLKPASETPLTALALADFAAQAGIPAGVFNVVTSTDSKAVGEELCTNEKVRKLSFTGSTNVGKTLMRHCADSIKRVSLELGGNAPFIVFDDANLDNAIAGALASKYRNAGQTCVCTNRFLVQEGIYDAFVKKLAAAVGKFKVGNGLEHGVSIGPLINKKGLDKVKEMVNDAVSKGGSVVIGGNEMQGLFYEPTVIANANSSMMLAKEEIFGPVSPIFKFKTEEEAIEMANDTIYGLASYFYSNDVSRCWRVAEKLEYGMVGINEGLISTEVAPFGGIKQSGIGREGSKYGIEEYIEVKYMCYGNIK